MHIRVATTADIPDMQVVRNAVKENVLSNPALVTDKDCEEYITTRGRGWICQVDSALVGFAIADLKDNSVWALFVLPEYEKMGIGKKLHDTMMNWYFQQDRDRAWLTTDPGTRAQDFYNKAGWIETGRKANGEIKFELTKKQWQK